MKKTFSFLISLVAITQAFSQGLTFYHMRNVLPQGSHFSATAFPNADFYINMLSLNVGLNNSFRFDDFGSIVGDSIRIDLAAFLDDEEDEFIQQTSLLDLPLLNLGIRTSDRSNLTIFSNIRSKTVVGYPKKLANWIVKGNMSFAGEVYKIDDLGLESISFGEIGVGYMRDIDVAGMEFRVGARLKYLMGLLYMGSDENPEVFALTSPSANELKVWSNPFQLKTAGFGMLEEEDDEDYADPADVLFQNAGFGIDLSAEWHFNDKLNINWAINDIGSITWDTNAKSNNFIIDTVSFQGVSIKAPDDQENYSFSEVLSDSLSDLFSDETIEGDTTSSSFKTGIGARSFLGATYEIVPNGQISVTLSNYSVFGKLKSAYGIGYTQELGNILALSTTVARIPQSGINFGLGTKIQLGFLQFYLVADGIQGLIDLKQAQQFDLWAGLNFQFGNPRKRENDQVDAVDF